MLKLCMKCIYCNNEKLYELKSLQLKCSQCKKKFSIKKVQRDLELIKSFCDGKSANEAHKKLNLNYETVKNRYNTFRQLIANFLEEQYMGKTVIEYDEYIYLEKSKKKIKKNIFDSQNFLTFHYDNKVYNLLMTDLSKYKNQFIDDGAEDAYFKEFSKFMMLNKISKIQKKDNLITQFWIFFENYVVRYKGIKSKYFFYYLKEIEFKFNYKYHKQILILENLLFQR